MDTKKFQRATEIMNELNRLHESLQNLKMANTLCFTTLRGELPSEYFYEKSPTFTACRDAAISVAERRIAQLEKEFNEL